MNSLIKWLFILSVLLVGGFFFLQSEEARLKKKTLKLIQVLLAPQSSQSTLAILRKAESITKLVHFSVQYQVQMGSHSYQNRTLNRLRSDLVSYFKRREHKESIIKIPSKQDITVSLSQESQKAQVRWVQIISYQKKKMVLSCAYKLGERKILAYPSSKS